MSEVQPQEVNSQPGMELNAPETGQVATPNFANSDDQPATESSTGESVTKVTMEDGSEISLDELKSGYMKDADYRQKTAALAERQRELARTGVSQQAEAELDPEIQKAVSVLREAGMATKEDLIAMQAQEEDERRLQNLLKSNPELKAQEKAIRAVGKTDNSAWEDIVTNYGFSSKDKLSVAKANRAIVGDSTPQPTTQKSLKDMTDEEYAAWKSKELGGSSGFFTKS